MKKIICMLISLIVLLGSASALAEDFSIHSGVEFGMSMDEITKLEKDAGFIAKEYGDDGDALRVTGKIASISDSSITYTFDNGELFLAEYSFGDDSVIVSDSEYSTILQSLIKRYGDPTGLPNGIHTDSYERATSSVKAKPPVTDDGKIERTNGWFIQGDDMYLAIEHFTFYMPFTRSALKSGFGSDYPNGAAFYHKIAYQSYALDDPEIMNAFSTILEDSQQLIDDL